MKLSKFILILLIVFFVLIGATSFIYQYSHKPEIITVSMDLTVEDTNIIGMNADADALHFGTVPRKGTSIRRMGIANNQNYPLFVNISIEGDFTDWISISDNNFILQPKESLQVEFKTTVPKNASFKIYNGTAYIVLRRY